MGLSRETILRNGTIAVVVGGACAFAVRDLAWWPLFTLLFLWPTFGGHFVELGYLKWLRPRLSRGMQVAARVIVWFFAGIVFLFCIQLTAGALGYLQRMHWPAWWVAGLGFVGIELVVHLTVLLRGRPNFFDGRG